MKTLIYKIIIFTVFFSTVQKISAQRNVVWVHGLNDNQTAWQYYNQIFDAERSEFTISSSLRTTYPTDNGITNAANTVINSVNTYYGTTGSDQAHASRNIGIGHSMGGLMLRDVDRLNGNGNKNFGGYITVTSPNYGAPISNSIIDGSVESASENACHKLSAGPVAQFLPLGYAIVANITVNNLCNYFINSDLLSNLQGTPITNADLRVGSPTINAINNHNTNTPRISVWAEENSPVHWRLLSSAMYGNDQTFVTKMHSVRGVYNTMYIANLSISIGCGIGGFWNPSCWYFSASFGYKARQWRKGRNWIDDSENIWSSLIKTTRREQQTYMALIDVFGNVWDGDNTTGSLGLHWEQRTRWISVNYPSDGLLPKYTQCLQGLPNNDGTRYKVNGANHLEVRNMSAGNVDETAIEFRRIFNRNDFFHTD